MKFTTEQIAEVMLRARLQYEGYDQDKINQTVAEDLPDTYYTQEAELILDWLEDNEPEARALASLLIRTPPDFNFNEGLILDALIARYPFNDGDMVVLTEVPPGLIADLPEGDGIAINAIVGKPLKCEWDEGKVMLSFAAPDGDDSTHVIWVDPKYVRAADV